MKWKIWKAIEVKIMSYDTLEGQEIRVFNPGVDRNCSLLSPKMTAFPPWLHPSRFEIAAIVATTASRNDRFRNIGGKGEGEGAKRREKKKTEVEAEIPREAVGAPADLLFCHGRIIWQEETSAFFSWLTRFWRWVCCLLRSWKFVFKILI